MRRHSHWYLLPKRGYPGSDLDTPLPNFLFQPLISIVVLITIGNRFIYSFIVSPSLKWKSRRAETDYVLSSTAAVPNIFGTRDCFRGRQFFQGPGRGDGFCMTQAHYIYCALYFYYYYISSTSDRQALDPRGLGDSCPREWTMGFFKKINIT